MLYKTVDRVIVMPNAYNLVRKENSEAKHLKIFIAKNNIIM